MKLYFLGTIFFVALNQAFGAPLFEHGDVGYQPQKKTIYNVGNKKYFGRTKMLSHKPPKLGQAIRIRNK